MSRENGGVMAKFYRSFGLARLRKYLGNWMNFLSLTLTLQWCLVLLPAEVKVLG